jgi:hypothetical protein
MKARDQMIKDLEGELDKALFKTSEARHKKKRYKNEVERLLKVCEDLTENLRDAE